MATFNVDQSLDYDNLLNSLDNLVLLRSDLHTSLDERKFVFYPKGDGSFVTHVLQPSPDLVPLYHNTKVQSPFNCHPSFLYARLAWTIFPLLTVFWSIPGVKRVVLTRQKTDKGTQFVEEAIYPAAQLWAKITASRSRSPKKRSRGQDDVEAVDTRAGKQRRTTESSAARLGVTKAVAPPVNHAAQLEAVKAVEAPVLKLSADSRQITVEPGVDVMRLCPTWHPEYEKMQNLKRLWLERERLKSNQPSTDVAVTSKSSFAA